MSLAVGVYQAGASPLHRAPAGAKLAGLTVACGVLAFATTPLWVGVATVVVITAYAVARVGVSAAWAQVRPIRWLVAVVLAVQLLITDYTTAVSLTGRIVLAVALAGLVTLTTRTSDLVAAMERCLAPLRRVGVDPARIALTVTLAMRSVPVVAGIAANVRDAQRARGRERDVRAFAVPLVVGALRHADSLGEALRARGLDD